MDRAEMREKIERIIDGVRAPLATPIETYRATDDIMALVEPLVGEREKGLAAVKALIESSRGVDGLHLNGDVAPWDELRTGGRFEEWLRDFDAALAQERRT